MVATEVAGLTQAIAEGLQKAANFVAAMAIAALKNLCAPRPIPFLFGGDGAIVPVPPGLLALLAMLSGPSPQALLQACGWFVALGD